MGDKLGQRGDKRRHWRQKESKGDICKKGIELEEPPKFKIAKNISLCPRDVSRTGNATFRRVSQVGYKYGSLRTQQARSGGNNVLIGLAGPACDDD
jgi:hypothetical protein